jgi:hypothetical protein
MKLSKVRGPALAAAAVLLIGGATSVFAESPNPATQAPGASQVEPVGTDGAGVAPEAPEAPGAEADGPGGHEDPAGQDVDHQFDGEE